MRLTTTVTVRALARDDAEVRATLAPGTDVFLGSEVGDWTAIRGPDEVRGWTRTASLSPATAPRPIPSSPPDKAPGSPVPTLPPSSGPPVTFGDVAPGLPAPPAGHGVYHTRRWTGLSLQSQGDVDALSLSQARLAGTWAEIGYTLTAERAPGVDEDSYFLSLSGNFRFFPLQPRPAMPLGMVVEAIASVGRSLDEDAEGQLYGVGGHAGVFARIPLGSAVLIPRVGSQLTRLIPLPDSDLAVTVSQWYVGAELQFGSVVPNVFTGRHEGQSFVVFGITFAY